MRVNGEYVGAQRNLDGDLIISFAVEESRELLEELEHLKEKKLIVEAKQYRQKRSLNANNYFWKLCDLLAEKMGSTQDEIHDLMLYRYGVRGDLKFSKDMLKAIRQNGDFDIVQVLYETDTEVEARCWVGSRKYDTKEMARLLEGTIHDAKEQGIDVYSKEETDRLLEMWERGK